MREAKIISVVLNLITRVGLSLLVLLSHHQLFALFLLCLLASNCELHDSKLLTRIIYSLL